MIEAVKRIPCYISTILFRVLSLSLTMAYIRFWAAVPLTLLIIELTLISWIRNKKRKVDSITYTIARTINLVVNNFAVMNAYSIWELDDDDDVEEKKEIEDFVRISSITTYFHHSICLLTIAILARNNTSYFKHWNQPNFLLKPSHERFYWVFGFTLLMGMYSLTAILYRIRHLAAMNVKSVEQVELVDQ